MSEERLEEREEVEEEKGQKECEEERGKEVEEGEREGEKDRGEEGCEEWPTTLPLR